MKIFRKRGKAIAAFLLVVIITQVIEPSVSFALTGGPSQPEVQSFEPVATTQMVDPFTGDFSYNIPLLDVGGYPINLSYHAGPTMDEESSWVGLGWNINPGVINRNVRGIPDDFNGEKVKREFTMRDNNTVGISGGATIEIFGFDAIGLGAEVGLGLNYNNYKGLSYEAFVNPALSVGKNSGPSMTANLGMSASSDGGVSINPSLSFSAISSDKQGAGLGIKAGIGLSYNSLQGLKSLNYGVGPYAQRKINDKDKTSGFNAIQSTIGFTSPTYTPYTDLPMSNFGVSFRATIGAAAFGTHPAAFISGYFAGQSLASNEEEVPAYGYLFAHNADTKSMHDLNREKDGMFSEVTPALPLASHTYDVYAVSGQGISGSYRPYRNDIGILHDAEVTSNGHDLSGIDLGVELGGGGFAHFGVNLSTTWNESHSGMWRDNDYAGIFGFGTKKDDGLYEPFYFKRAGELLEGIDKERFDALKGAEAIRPVIDDESQRLTKNLKTDKNESFSVNGFDSKRSVRAKRDQHISLLDIKEAEAIGVNKKIYSYAYNDFSLDPSRDYSMKRTVVDLPSEANKTQMSELTVTKEDGARYVYGIPAFNTAQHEVVLSTDGTDKGNGLVLYTDEENSMDNGAGDDHYFSKTSTPAFAHSYLLTSILSPDYEDIDHITGPSPGDRGDYVIINYTRAVSDYNWRVPYDSNEANFNYGIKSDPHDNKASYIAGTKDIWYVHSMETRNYVAEFELENRDDGIEARDHNGGLGTNSLKRLKQIRLFSRGDKLSSAKNGTAPNPLKVVHFEYDYSLCPGIRNTVNQVCDPADPNCENKSTGQGGKLTLKKIYFTYQNSFKGRLTPYKFNYNNLNPYYDPKGNDRWGMYKPDNSSGLPNAEFPYTSQTDANIHDYASAWSLSEIELPSGGVLKIDYESDDYAFVQDKRAMEMIKITGAGDVTAASGSNYLYTGNNVHEYFYFDLNQPISGVAKPEADQLLGDQYFRDHEGRDMTESDQWMYFRFLVNLDKNPGKDKEEYIQGYMQVAEYGVVGDAAPFTKGYIRIRPVQPEGNDPDDDKNAHPISKTSWQFIRRNNLKIVTSHNHDFPDFGLNDIGNPEKAIPSFLSSIFKIHTFFLGDELIRFISGFNDYLHSQDYARTFDNGKSWVRLFTPHHKKFGGGHRVKRISLNDRWKSLAGERDNYKNAEYGQEFTYTIDDPLGAGISSGVAAYEPILGGDEIPHRKPVFFTDEVMLGPDNQFMQETPYGESFYPAPLIGYRKVTVTSLRNPEFTKRGTGKVVHEFFTAKDFPVPETRMTECDKAPKPWNFGRLLLERIFGLDAKHHLGASQGFVVELNDMHGKPKARWEYDVNESLISGVEYKYKTANGNLDNQVKVIKKEAPDFIEDATVGVEADIVVDMRESENDIRNFGGDFNGDVIPALFIPILIPMIWPQYSHENTRLRTASITKVIRRYGILNEVITYNQSSRVSVVNEAYDAETGQVLLTRSANNFEDPVYTFSYPAHWVYEGMGPAYRNQGYTSSLTISSGSAFVNNAALYYHPGDILLVDDNGLKKLWVTEVYANSIKVQDMAGSGYSSNGQVPVKVIRSGRRNLQSASIGSIVTLQNPISGNKLSFKEVINASASEYSDVWPTLCNCGNNETGSITAETYQKIDNAFANGSRGDWRLKTSLSYLDKRKITSEDGNTNIRKDGIYENTFLPFWKAPEISGRNWERETSFTKMRWDTTNIVQAYNPLGHKIEYRDALGIPSASLYGYGHTMPIGISTNARYRDIGFDNFEDYDYKTCFDDHFSFSQNSRFSISSDHAHSGRKSILVGPNSSVTMKKKIK